MEPKKSLCAKRLHRVGSTCLGWVRSNGGTKREQVDEWKMGWSGPGGRHGGRPAAIKRRQGLDPWVEEHQEID